MKTRTLLLWIVCGLWSFQSLMADGFIVVHQPWPILPPGPPPPRWPVPPHRVYPFAPLEVTRHQVQVRITDQVAVTSVDQEFYNPNDRQLEGTYLFPVPAGAQIDKFTMEIGGRPVDAELLAADKARQIYEDIVRKMKDPALLEYSGRDVFKVRIFPIEPRSHKQIKLRYSQVLKADHGLVQYLYPLNTEKFSAKPLKTVSLKIDVETKQPLKTIYSPSHAVEVQRHGSNRATVGYETKDAKPDTDFQLFYAAEKGDIGANLMTYRTGTEDGFFLLLASPSVDLKPDKVVLKDVVFVLDTSGSMAGNKLNQAKKALQFCVENLREGDRFEVMRFSTEPEMLFNHLVDADADHRQRARDFVKDLRPMGGTAIDDALRQALGLRPQQSSRPFVIIFLTDGLPTIGVTDENQILAHLTERLKTESGGQTRLFCFGIGNDVNTHLLDKLSEATKGSSQYVLAEEDLELKLSSFFSKINEPVMTDPKLQFPEGVRVTKLHPSPLPDLFKGDQLVVVGRYSGHAQGRLTLTGLVNGKSQQFTYDVDLPERAADLDFIPRLWATRRVGYLIDEIRLRGENAELKEEVTELARQYGLVTPYTAYLIVEDEKQRNVPLASQSLPQLREDKAGLDLAQSAWQESSVGRSGGGAVARARYGMAMKSATAPALAMEQGTVEAQRNLSYAAAARPGTADRGAQVAERVVQYTRQSRFVSGRNFFQNGQQWIDAEVQNHANVPRLRIQFGSAEYFELVNKWPQTAPWLALGNQIQFVLNGKVYEIHE
jgi:Ca-activated chloride channel homolog